MPQDTPLTFADPEEASIPLALLTAEAYDGWRLAQEPGARGWAEANGFTAGLGQVLLFPGEDGRPEAALGGVGTAQDRARGRFALAGVAQSLPAGCYHIESGLPQDPGGCRSRAARLAARRLPL